MKKVLVTGATGCVGSNLVITLLERGFDVRAFHRATSSLTTLGNVDVEHCIGDVRDVESLRNAMKGCDTIFHTAAVVSYWKPRYTELMDVNINGTRNVVEACLSGGVEKLVHTSSVAAIGYRTDGQLIDETMKYNWKAKPGYRYSKLLSEQEIISGVQHGLNASIVNPAVIIGPRDKYVHGGQIVRDIRKGKIPVYVAGGMNIVSVYDVVAGHIAAAERGKAGERYILGGVNLTHKEVFALAAKVLNGHAPLIKAPAWGARALAAMFDAVGTVTRRPPWISSDLLEGMGKFNWYSTEKANRELGYRQTPVEDAMRDAYRWYAGHGMA